MDEKILLSSLPPVPHVGQHILVKNVTPRRGRLPGFAVIKVYCSDYERIRQFLGEAVRDSARNQPAYLQEVIAVIRKYMAINRDQLSVQLEGSNNCAVLELNVTE